MTSARDYKMDVLKEQLATSQKTEMLLANENVDLRTENVKLRDLVYSILKCAGEIDRDRGCDVCPMNTDGDLESYLDGTWCKLRPTLREVGIEVEYEAED